MFVLSGCWLLQVDEFQMMSEVQLTLVKWRCLFEQFKLYLKVHDYILLLLSYLS